MKHKDYCYVDVAIGGPSKRNNFINLATESVELPDPPVECYQTAFRYPKVITEGTAGYRGLHYLDAVYFDFDHGADFTLDNCRNSTAAFLSWLQSAYKIPADAIDIWFSGRKGFHVYIPSALFGIKPSTRLASVVRQLVEHLTQQFDEEVKATGLLKMIDLKVYDRVRLFRLPGSIHGKSELYKIQLSLEDLWETCAEDIEELATKPQMGVLELDFDVEPIPALKALYDSFDLKVETKSTEGSDETKPDFKYGEPCYIRMLEGVGEGQRDAVCLRLATFFKKKGMDRAMVETALLQWNEKNDPPLED